MNYKQVIDILKSNKNEPGILKWQQRKTKEEKIESLGIGLTILRKMAKKIGKDHELASQLWESDIYDARVISILIDDPKEITIAQAEKQVENLKQGQLAHVFSACGAPLSKSPLVVDLVLKWRGSKDAIRRSCSYGLIYELSKSKKKAAPDNTFFLECVEKINDTFENESNGVQVAMGGALLGIGKRNAILNTAALKVAKKIGPIQIESDNKDCEPFNVVKHLTSDYIINKLGL
jgi:3-methyladenine DNA glycosylase AlkD